MPFTPVRDIEYIEVGSMGKETLSNDAFLNLSLGISGTVTIPLTGDYTLTEAQALNFVLILTGSLTADVDLTVPLDTRVYVVDNRTTGAFAVNMYPSAGGGVSVEQGARTLVYCDGSNVYPVASGTGAGGGGGAPTDASYLVQTASSGLSAERVVTNSPTVVWDFTVAGQAAAVLPNNGVTYAKIQHVTEKRLLGRYLTAAGDLQEITPGTTLSLSDSGVLDVVSPGGQPADATLDALAGLATGANQLPYFTGTDTAAQTLLTAFARTLLDDADAATVRTTLALVPGTNVQTQDATLQALANLATSANTLIFFTGTDTASLTPITSFARNLLDDNNANQARQTLGITATGTPSVRFTELLDVPTSYTGQGGKTVAVKADQTGLEFVTGASGFQPLDATLTALADLATAANTAPFFTAADTAALMTVTTFARTLLDDIDAAAMRLTLGLVPGTDVQAVDPTLTALAGVTTGVDLMPYFTGVDTASTTTVTSFARELLDDVDAAAMRATLEIAGGGGASDFLGLSDTPDVYTGHGLEGVRVNTGATALEFAPLITTLLGLADVPDSYTGHANQAVTVRADETGVEFTAQPYDVGLTWSGTLPTSQVLLRYPFPRAADFPAGLTNSQAVAAVAATGSTVLDIRKNGTSVGSATYAAAGTTATFTMASATSFAAGDVLTIVAPASPDATLADIGLALAGTRA